MEIMNKMHSRWSWLCSVINGNDNKWAMQEISIENTWLRICSTICRDWPIICRNWANSHFSRKKSTNTNYLRNKCIQGIILIVGKHITSKGANEFGLVIRERGEVQFSRDWGNWGAVNASHFVSETPANVEKGNWVSLLATSRINF